MAGSVGATNQKPERFREGQAVDTLYTEDEPIFWIHEIQKIGYIELQANSLCG
jgi:hypothetical protein